MSASYATYKAADTSGSAYDLALANMRQQTEAHAQLLAHLGKNSGGRRTRRKTKRKGRGRKQRSRRKVRGGAVEFTVPANVAEPPVGQSHYPVQGVLGNLLAVGSQHQENSRYDADMNAAPAVYSSGDAIKAATGGRRKHKRTKRR